MTSDPSKDAAPDGKPVPTTSANEAQSHAPRKRLLIVSVVLGVVLALGAGLTLLALAVTNSDKLQAFSSARSDLIATQTVTTEVLEEAGALEPELLSDLEGKLEHIEELLSEEPPSSISFGIDDRVAALLEGISGVDDPIASLEGALEARSQYESQLSDAEEELAEAHELLESTSGEVLDDEIHDQLSEHIATMEEVLEKSPDDTSGESFAALTPELESTAEDVRASRDEVSESHEGWVQAEKERKEAEREREEAERKAEEEAAQKDPANYDSPSERDWALVERDPDSHEGEKYLLYGYVTQADAATGDISIRVDTSPVQKYRWYDYDVNTFVVAGSEGVFSDVVQGDHVRILAEVTGSFTYSTTIGGSATAVMIAAYDIEVIGQL